MWLLDTWVLGELFSESLNVSSFQGRWEYGDSYISYMHVCMNSSNLQVSTCDVCQRNNQKLNIMKPELHNVPVQSPLVSCRNWFHWTNHTTSQSGNKCYLAKWAEAKKRGTRSCMFIILLQCVNKYFIRSLCEWASQISLRLTRVLSLRINSMMKLLGIKHHDYGLPPPGNCTFLSWQAHHGKTYYS